MELFVPYILLILSLSPDGDMEVLKQELTASESVCLERKATERANLIDSAGNAYHLLCIEVPSSDEFDAVFRARP